MTGLLPRTFTAMALFAMAWLTAGVCGRAQSTEGYLDVFYDSELDQVFAFAGTYPDYETLTYYDPKVDVSLWCGDDICSGWNNTVTVDYGTYVYAEMSWPAKAGLTYYAYATHSLKLDWIAFDPEIYSYWDYYGYSFNPCPPSPCVLVEREPPSCWWFPPLVAVVLYAEIIDLGSSEAELTMPTVSIEIDCPPGVVCSGPPATFECLYTPVTHLAETVRAVAAPSGGTFHWTLGSKLLAKSGTTGSAVEVEGVEGSSAPADTWIKVTYTLEDGSSASASVPATVRFAFKLRAKSMGGVENTTLIYSSLGVYRGYLTTVYYDATDQFGENNVIVADGPEFAEVLSTLYVSEPVTFDPPDGQKKSTRYVLNEGGRDVLSVTAATGDPFPDPFRASREQILYFENEDFSPQYQDYYTTYAEVEIEWLHTF